MPLCKPRGYALGVLGGFASGVPWGRPRLGLGVLLCMAGVMPKIRLCATLTFCKTREGFSENPPGSFFMWMLRMASVWRGSLTLGIKIGMCRPAFTTMIRYNGLLEAAEKSRNLCPRGLAFHQRSIVELPEDS